MDQLLFWPAVRFELCIPDLKEPTYKCGLITAMRDNNSICNSLSGTVGRTTSTFNVAPRWRETTTSRASTSTTSSGTSAPLSGPTSGTSREKKEFSRQKSKQELKKDFCFSPIVIKCVSLCFHAFHPCTVKYKTCNVKSKNLGKQFPSLFRFISQCYHCWEGIFHLSCNYIKAILTEY